MNSGPTPPAQDDILVFRDSTNTEGHVAIITGVTSTSVTFVEQNWSITGTSSLSMSTSCTNAGCSYQIADRISYPADNPGGVAFPVVGWLRLPSSPITTITFDESITFQQSLGIPDTNIYKVAITQGYTFTSGPASGNGLLVANTCNGSNVCDGSAVLYSYLAFPSIVMTNGASRTFSLIQFDAAPPFLPSSPNAYYINPTQLQVAGVQADGTTLSASFALVPNVFQTFTLPPGWANLSSVTFTGSGPSCNSTGCFEFLLDNIAVQ